MLIFEISSLKEIDIMTKEEMISLSQRLCKVTGKYLLSRFEIYDQVICLRRNQKLLAFQLIQTFSYDGDLFVYFGPLFSRMSCFLDLFMNYLDVVMEENQGRKIHLLAEIENPEVLLLFKALFEDQAYPKFQDCQVKDEIKAKVLIYSEKLSHIENLDAERLTSTSKDFLNPNRLTHLVIENWLRSRNIDLSQGMNVVLYSAIPDRQIARCEYVNQLEEGRKKMANWKVRKEEVLGLFEGGIGSNA